MILTNTLVLFTIFAILTSYLKDINSKYGMFVPTDLYFTFDIIDLNIYCSRRPRMKVFHHTQSNLGKALSFMKTKLNKEIHEVKT